MRSAALGVCCVACACAQGAPQVEQPAPVAPTAPKAAATAVPDPEHGPERAPDGEYFELAELVGRDLDALHPATCADPNGWQLDAALMVAERALAVRRCKRFRGPHDVGSGGQVGSQLSVISDGGLVVFAVATREYELGVAQSVSERLLRSLVLSGCEQVYADDRNTGFSGCPGRASWAAVSQLEIPADGGARHAVVLEVARDRELAAGIAKAFAERLAGSR